MAVRDDILNFMRSIKAGKQSVAESEWKQGAYAEAWQSHQDDLGLYAQQLTNFETDLADYKRRTGNWEADVQARQNAYQGQLNAYTTARDRFDTRLHMDILLNGPVSSWTNDQRENFKFFTGYYPDQPPLPPATPSFLPQPAPLETQHPGPIPSFEFSIPETPYTAALIKSSQASSMPTLKSASQNNYYRALEAQANQPKWWEVNR